VGSITGPITADASNKLVTDDPTPTLSVLAEAGSLVRLIVNGTEQATSITVPNNGLVSLTPSFALASGLYTFQVRAIDVAGNASALSSSR
ncbi:MAG: hypothetical protein EBV34_17230, partial [Betaproteobacteria bacterium]|nr:hypothetical protein [Betaproteobacteria bacterium]